MQFACLILFQQYFQDFNAYEIIKAVPAVLDYEKRPKNTIFNLFYSLECYNN